MDSLTELRARLERRDVPFEGTDSSIHVLAASPDGFDVMVTIEGSRARVTLAGWHEEFEDLEAGFNCFLFALSSECRLVVTKRWLDHKWTLQARKDGSWVDDSTTGLLLFPFILRPRIRFLQNQWWSTAEDHGE